MQAPSSNQPSTQRWPIPPQQVTLAMEGWNDQDLGDRDQFVRSLESLREQTYPLLEAEILVILDAAAEEAATDMAAAPAAGEAFMWNMGLVLVLVLMFYVLLIRPQQKRFKEHSMMLAALEKGDKVVTGGGLVGTIDKITEGNEEVVVDLGGGVKVTAMRSTLQGKDSHLLEKKPANDPKAGSEAKK